MLTKKISAVEPSSVLSCYAMQPVKLATLCGVLVPPTLNVLINVRNQFSFYTP